MLLQVNLSSEKSGHLSKRWLQCHPLFNQSLFHRPAILCSLFGFVFLASGNFVQFHLILFLPIVIIISPNEPH